MNKLLILGVCMTLVLMVTPGVATFLNGGGFAPSQDRLEIGAIPEDVDRVVLGGGAVLDLVIGDEDSGV